MKYLPSRWIQNGRCYIKAFKPQSLKESSSDPIAKSPLNNKYQH